jgi:hypothetical protein
VLRIMMPINLTARSCASGVAYLSSLRRAFAPSLAADALRLM